MLLDDLTTRYEQKNSSVNSCKQPRLIDTTLREGAQVQGVRFGIDESVEIARALVGLNVDTVECGHPSISDVEQQRVQAVVKACGSVPVLAHARAHFDDIEAVHDTGAKWVGIFIGVNTMSLSARVRPSEPFRRVIENAVRRARTLGLSIRFTVEDATRTPWPELSAAFNAALDAGANRICLADTVGLLCPWEVDTLIQRIVETFAGVEVEVHFHDDRGLSCANALSALRAGAGWVSCSINGIGERCGITDTLTLLTNLGALKWRVPPAGHLLQKASRLVQAHARLPVDRWRPVVGENATIHVARLHKLAVKANPHAYAWIDPCVIGRKTSISNVRLPENIDNLVSLLKSDSAVAPYHHSSGAGNYYIVINDDQVRDARQSCTILDIPSESDRPVFTSACRFICDTLFVFLGYGSNMSGLSVEVTLGDRTLSIESPHSVLIPAGILHSYKVITGTGMIVNFAASGNLGASQLEKIELSSYPSMDILHSFVQDRIPGTLVTPDTLLLDVFDSLIFIDFFIYLESIFGDAISLDVVSSCKTFNDLVLHLDSISISVNAHMQKYEQKE